MLTFKKVGYWAKWPSLNKAGYTLAEGVKFDDTLIPGNMAYPLSHGAVYICSVCNEKLYIVDCLLFEAQFKKHLHGNIEFSVQDIHPWSTEISTYNMDKFKEKSNTLDEMYAAYIFSERERRFGKK